MSILPCRDLFVVLALSLGACKAEPSLDTGPATPDTVCGRLSTLRCAQADCVPRLEAVGQACGPDATTAFQALLDCMDQEPFSCDASPPAPVTRFCGPEQAAVAADCPVTGDP